MRAHRAAPRSELGVLRLTLGPASAVVNGRRFGDQVALLRSGRYVLLPALTLVDARGEPRRAQILAGMDKSAGACIKKCLLRRAVYGQVPPD